MTDSAQMIVSRDEARSIDDAATTLLGIPGLLLMENAARGVCDELLRAEHPAGRTVIICGPGNNGGDGLALARQLAARGTYAEVLLVPASKNLTQDAEQNLRILKAAGIEVTDVDSPQDLSRVTEELKGQDCIVDCLLGTGVRGAVRPPFDGIIAAVNQSAAAVISVDVPSGLDCDSGTAAGPCVVASKTVTFVAMKQGFRNDSAAAYTGDVSVAHIGLPDSWTRQWLEHIRAAGR